MEKESDLDNLRSELVDDLGSLNNLVVEARLNKLREKYNVVKIENTKLYQLVSKLVKQLEFLYNNYPEILYGTSGTVQPSPGPQPKPSPGPVITPPTPPPTPPLPDPVVVEPKPTPVPDKPDDTPKPPSPEEVAAKELKSLKDEIIKLPLNETEKSALTRAKNKEEAEAVRTQYNQRVGEAAAEEGKYDTLLSDIQKETELKKLEDGEYYDTEIGKLKAELLPTSKQLSALQTKRREKKAELVKKQLQEAKDNALAKDISGNNWDPVLEEEEQRLINSANDPEEVKKYQTQIGVKRDSIKSATDLLDNLNN